MGLTLQIFQLILWKYGCESMIFFQGERNWESLLIFWYKNLLLILWLNNIIIQFKVAFLLIKIFLRIGHERVYWTWVLCAPYIIPAFWWICEQLFVRLFLELHEHLSCIMIWLLKCQYYLNMYACSILCL